MDSVSSVSPRASGRQQLMRPQPKSLDQSQTGTQRVHCPLDDRVTDHPNRDTFGSERGAINKSSRLTGINWDWPQENWEVWSSYSKEPSQ